MQVSSEVVGKALKEYRTKITQRQINNYAAAVGDPNPVYLDDGRKGGVIAPPTLAAAVTWPIIQNIYKYVDLGYPPEILFQLVHYSEHLAIHRPMQPGDELSVRGEVAAVVPEKSGTHIVFKLPAFDSRENPVFTEYIGGLLRGVDCPDGGRGSDNIPGPVKADSNQQPLWQTAQPITREACYIYEGCADVPFPIHTSPSFARSVGLPDIIYFGIGTLAHAVREMVNREGAADPSGVKTISCRFRGMVLPDSFIRIQLLQRNVDSGGIDLSFRVLNREDREAVSDGSMHIDP